MFANYLTSLTMNSQPKCEMKIIFALIIAFEHIYCMSNISYANCKFKVFIYYDYKKFHRKIFERESYLTKLRVSYVLKSTEYKIKEIYLILAFNYERYLS